MGCPESSCRFTFIQMYRKHYVPNPFSNFHGSLGLCPSRTFVCSGLLTQAFFILAEISRFEPFIAHLFEHFFPFGKRKALGYANEVGEAFRSLISPFLVHLTYGISTIYVLADTFDKAKKAYDQDHDPKKVSIAGVDTLLWQGFASVIIPGFTINRICALSFYSLSKIPRLKCSTAKWMTTAIGLGSIPFIIKPIDEFVEYAMNNTFRKVF